MVIDIHAHIWGGNYETNKKEIIKACELYGISRVYISGLMSYFPDIDEINELNYEVYKFSKEYPKYIGGFCYINPIQDNCIDVLRKGIEEYGMEGMKLWVATYCADPRVFPLVEKCIDYNIPILVHSFHKAVGQLEFETTGIHTANLAQRYPEARIIMAHLGGNAYHGIKAIQKYKNVWVDISGSIYRRDEVDYTVERIGAERVLFGTDMTGSYLVNYGQIEEADLTPEERELIYYKNSIKVLNLRDWR